MREKLTRKQTDAKDDRLEREREPLGFVQMVVALTAKR